MKGQKLRKNRTRNFLYGQIKPNAKRNEKIEQNKNKRKNKTGRIKPNSFARLDRTLIVIVLPRKEKNWWLTKGKKLKAGNKLWNVGKAKKR